MGGKCIKEKKREKERRKSVNCTGSSDEICANCILLSSIDKECSKNSIKDEYGYSCPIIFYLQAYITYIYMIVLDCFLSVFLSPLPLSRLFDYINESEKKNFFFCYSCHLRYLYRTKKSINNHLLRR